LLNILNVALRGITLLSKFILIFFLAKYLEPDQVGLYGLLTATIGYAFYFLGFEFYTYSNRELIKKNPSDWALILKSQAIFTVFMYIVFLPLLSLIFIFKLLPIAVVFYFFILLVLEHFAQEFNRIFVALSRPLLASIVLFIRSASWIYIVVIMMFFKDSLRNLDFLLQNWLIGALAACLLSIFVIYKMKLSGWSTSINRNWIKQGVIKSAPFFLAAAALRGLFTIDRYWMESLTDLKTVGAYVLFMSVSNAMISFLDSGVFVFSYPKLIQAYEAKKPNDFKKQFRKLMLQVFSFLVLFITATLFLIQPVLILLGKQHYTDHQWIFPYLLLATAFFCIGMIPQYGLYAQNKDRQIIVSNVLSFIVFVLTTSIFTKLAPAYAVIIGLNVSLFCGTAWCTIMFIKNTQKEYYN
jgi:O-antigen/teichoic acid export membrane protein